MGPLAALGAANAWLDRIDPGAHRRVKGLRFVTGFGLAALMSALPEIAGASRRPRR